MEMPNYFESAVVELCALYKVNALIRKSNFIRYIKRNKFSKDIVNFYKGQHPCYFNFAKH